MRLIIDDKIPYIRTQAERLGTCVYLPGTDITPDHVRHADVLIVRTRTVVNRALLEGSSVQLVVTATIGHDHIDTHYLAEVGIAWTNCPGCNATSVAQYVRNALWVASLQGLIDPLFAQGERQAAPTVGVVGCGHVGTAVEAALRAEGCHILRCDPPKGEAHTLADLAREAQVITLHTPLTHEGTHATYHLANAQFFQSLQRQPLFINAARGECMDTAALLHALDSGHVSGAVIDTWEHEPNPWPALLERALIATPHIAGYSADGKANATRMALEAVARHFQLPLTFDIQPPSFPHDEHFMPSPQQNASPLPPHIAEQLRLYHPMADTLRLRAMPHRFEWLRGHYPLRREA